MPNLKQVGNFVLDTDETVRAARRAMKVVNTAMNQHSTNLMLKELNDKYDFSGNAAQASSGKTMDFDRTSERNVRRRLRSSRGAGLQPSPNPAAPLRKIGLQMDGLGKNTSPANMGNAMEPPMPQTNYAKGTLDNEYANRIYRGQLRELNRNRGNSGTSGNSSTSSTTTTTNGTTTTTTSTGLANSGLTAALSLGSWS